MQKIAILVLWSLVLAGGVLCGGSIFERVALTPLWAGSPPESVTSWPYGVAQRPFFIVVTPAWALLSLAVLALASALPEPARPWARAAGIGGVAVMIWTGAFFIPILQKTEAVRGAGLAAEEITRLARQFTRWGVLRTALAAGAWIAGLRALVLAGR